MAKTKKISVFNVATPLGDLVLSAKSGEDPEFRPFASSVEDSDDAISTVGEMILNTIIERTYVQGVFLYRDEDIPKLKSLVSFAATGGLVPANIQWSDGSIDSNTGVFVGGLIYNGTGTQELKFACGGDWINS